MQNVIDSLTKGVAEAFPGRELHYNRAVMSKIIKGRFITYDFAFAPGYANILHNAHGLIRLLIRDKEPALLKDINETDPVEVEAILYDHRFKNAGIKFRKINAKNVHEAVKKIVSWFEKNATAMQDTKFTD